MSKMARTKGANFEREIIKLIHDELGIECKRNLSQYQQKELCDVEVGDVFALECKRYASAVGGWFQQGWWVQASRSAALCNMIPVLVWKYDRQPIRFAMPIYSINSEYALDSEEYDYPREGNACKPVVMDHETAFMIMREWLA